MPRDAVSRTANVECGIVSLQEDTIPQSEIEYSVHFHSHSWNIFRKTVRYYTRIHRDKTVHLGDSKLHTYITTTH